MLDAGCWMLDAGCWILDTGCWMLDAGCWMLDTGGSYSGVRRLGFFNRNNYLSNAGGWIKNNMQLMEHIAFQRIVFN
jgi:hypothetical protein